MNSKLKVLSLFSGIGAFERALEKQGIDYELVGFSEIDKFAIESYCAIHNTDKTKNLGDITNIDEKELPDFDLMTYGFPCQSYSLAGKKLGLDDPRGVLFYDALRIIREKKPKYCIAENVKNLTGKKFKEVFEDMLAELDLVGYNNYWKILNSKDFGIPQNRERVFIVSIRKDIDNETFEFPKPLELRARLRDLLDDTVEDKYMLTREQHENFIFNITNNTKEHTKAESKGVYDVVGISPTLTTMNSGQREPKVIVKEATKKGYDIATEEDSINISFPKSKTRRGRVGKGVAQTLDTQCNQAVLQSNHTELPCIYDDRDKGFNGLKTSDICPTQRAERHGLKCITEDYKIRKLTPLECWRLMGFADNDYWAARTRLEETFYNGGDRSNSQMYKQAGNSIVVQVLEEIFKNLF